VNVINWAICLEFSNTNTEIKEIIGIFLKK
jgi:hypothetical protein